MILAGEAIRVSVFSVIRNNPVSGVFSRYKKYVASGSHLLYHTTRHILIDGYEDP